MNIKKITIVGFFVIMFFTVLNIFGFGEVYAQQYTPLESIPGGASDGSPTDFSTYIEGIYNFAVGFVVIAALLMITIGGFYYISSAGNQAQAGTAKKIVTDALLGLIVVFLTWLILNTINPDLVGSDPGGGVQNLRKSATTQRNASSAQSTQHSSDRVSQQATQPQTYCNGTQCFNSFSECSAAGGDCRSAQMTFDDPMKYYSDDGNGNYTEFQDLESCESAGGNCMMGSEMKARMLNNVKTNEELIQEADNAGLSIADDVKDDVNNMTEKTFETAKELGGTVTEVGINGATYKTQGVDDKETNGTRNAKEGTTIKNLEKLAIESPSDTVKVIQDKDTTPGTVYYKYEFSADHPDSNLAGTVATYSVQNTQYGGRNKTQGKKYSDVTVTAAQAIVQCREGGC